MKRFLLIAIFAVLLFFIHTDTNAQRGRYYRSYRSRPMVSIGVGGLFGGFYGARVWGYGPRVGVNIGVVLPPLGSRVRGLPPGATKTIINDIVYYQHNDVYFRERKDGGFETVEAPVGARVNRLPMGAKLKKIEGKYYYEKEGIIYYKWNDEGRPSYEIVGKNGVLTNDDEFYEEDDYETEDNSSQYNEEERNLPRVTDKKMEQADKDDVYITTPQVGDQFERLPKNSKPVSVNGETQYVSTLGTYYKEVTIDGKTFYEVVKVK